MSDTDRAIKQECDELFRSPDGIYKASFYIKSDWKDTTKIFDAVKKIPNLELLDISHISTSSKKEVEEVRAFYGMDEEPRMSDQDLIDSMDRIIENVELLRTQRDYLDAKVKQVD